MLALVLTIAKFTLVVIIRWLEDVFLPKFHVLPILHANNTSRTPPILDAVKRLINLVEMILVWFTLAIT